eukprot:300140-Amphidinium_carterae.1
MQSADTQTLDKGGSAPQPSPMQQEEQPSTFSSRERLQHVCVCVSHNPHHRRVVQPLLDDDLDMKDPAAGRAWGPRS